MPVYGVEKYIAQCAKSLFEQKGAELEFIFVNDATKDNSMGVLNEIVSHTSIDIQKSIKIINKATNEGSSLARRTGLSVATGEYIMFVDSDDWLSENAIETIAKVIDESKADLIYFNLYNYVAGQTRILSHSTYRTPIEYMQDIMDFSPNAPAYCWNKVVKRSLFNQITEWPVESMHEDVALLPQVIYAAHSLKLIEAPLYYYRRSNESSMSADYWKSKEKRRQSKENQLVLIRFLEKFQLQNIFKTQYRKLVIRCAYITTFFNCYDSENDFNYIPVLWKLPIYRNFDVSIRRQLQSRFIIYLKYFLKTTWPL